MNRLGVICFLAILYISGTYGLGCKKCEQTDGFATPDISKCASAATDETCAAASTKCGAKVDTANTKTVFGCFAPSDCDNAKYCCDTANCNSAITGGKDLGTAPAATTAAPAGAATTAAAGGAAATTAKTGGAAVPAVNLGVLAFVALIASKVI